MAITKATERRSPTEADPRRVGSVSQAVTNKQAWRDG